MTLSLSTINPDFDAIRIQLEDYLQTKDSWKGVLTTQTGQTLLEMIAAIGALNQLSIQRMGEDAFPYTALNNQAIYAITQMLGLRLSRKKPAECEVLLSNDTPLVIPPYTVFSVAGTLLFNRNTLNVTSTPTAFLLYEGEVIQVNAAGIGTNYATFISQQDAFTVSDSDVVVSINGIEQPKTFDGLWKLSGPMGYRDRTLPSGHLLIEFGTGIYGAKPSPSDVIQIVYAVTKGSAGNAIKTYDIKVSCDTYPTLQGVGNSDLVGGADETPPVVYKNVGGTAFGTFGSAVTRDQYKALILTYPGVVDGVAFAQREVNPNAPEWMNLIKVVLLTSAPWSQTQKDDFVSWLQDRSMYSTRFFLADPVPVPVDVSVRIFCYNFASLAQCRADAILALQDLFELRPGILNYDTYLSDINRTILNSNSNIEYVVIDSPTQDIIVSSQAIPAPVGGVTSPGGYLSAGTYLYAVSAVLDTGEIAPKNWGTVVVPENNSMILLTWPPVEGATSYRIWGRSTAQIGYIGSTDQTNFLEDGSYYITPTSAPQTTVPLKYSVLASLSVTAAYSARNPARALQG